jgi:CubicO group peptidase (beta-lactamase class C family)
MPTVDGPAARIEAVVRADRIPGLSVAVVLDGRVRWLRGFGVADLATGAPATAQTGYMWFSMTKIVTATAALRLSERGSLDLDAPVTEYFPPFAVVRQPRPVTVRHLLSHSSGLANPIPIRWVHAADRTGPDDLSFVETLLARHRRLRFAPGTRAAYSNLGYVVLGEVIAAACNQTFRPAVHDLVLKPAGMLHTGFTYEEGGEGLAATGHQRLPAVFSPLVRAILPVGLLGPRRGPFLTYRPFYVNGAAYGGLIGSVDDVARFALLHLGGGTIDGTRLLSPRTTAAMREPTPRGGRYDFGLGWSRPAGRRDGPAFVQHLGGGSGFFTMIRLYPDEGLAVCLMGNTTRYDHESITGVILTNLDAIRESATPDGNGPHGT